jgi:hypothetical protein
MSDVGTAINTLRRIEELWQKLQGAKTDTPEYAALSEQIRALSTEYQKIVVVAKTPD